MIVDAPRSSVERGKLSPYVLVRHKMCGLKLLPIPLKSGEQVLPVFSSAEAAQRFLPSAALGESWCVRECSAGEMVSLLFGLCANVKRVLLNPLPEPLTARDWLTSPVYR
ncbi:MAG: hypothetical protein JOZ19_05510 [Rubrobacter sp.]|nr:hypothetical protein [Rubrobacter sp.]